MRVRYGTDPLSLWLWLFHNPLLTLIRSDHEISRKFSCSKPSKVVTETKEKASTIFSIISMNFLLTLSKAKKNLFIYRIWMNFFSVPIHSDIIRFYVVHKNYENLLQSETLGKLYRYTNEILRVTAQYEGRMYHFESFCKKEPNEQVRGITSLTLRPVYFFISRFCFMTLHLWRNDRAWIKDYAIAKVLFKKSTREKDGKAFAVSFRDSSVIMRNGWWMNDNRCLKWGEKKCPANST